MSQYRAKKRLGQNFLKSEDIISKIIEAINPQPGEHIIEIGAGRGALTLPLAKSKAEVVAVEFDSDLIGYLTKLLSKYPHVKIVNTDFLNYNPEFELYTLVGNLPYNITSPVIEYACEHVNQIQRAYLMTQKEVAERISSEPNSKDWSPLAIFSQLCFDINIVMDISPKYFSPPPKVQSSLIEMIPKKNGKLKHKDAFHKVVRQAFKRRRKTLINNLSPDIIESSQVAKEILEHCGLSEKVRAEQINTESFLTLTNLLVEYKII